MQKKIYVVGMFDEGTAVNVTYGAVSLFNLTPTQFVTIASVMTLGIIVGPLFCLFGFKAYDKKVLSKAKVNEEVKELRKVYKNNIIANSIK